MPVTEMVDVTQETQLEVHTISGSQHMQAQPLGIGRVPSEANHLEAPIAPNIEPVREEYTPPVVEPTEAEPSFTQPISLAPPIVEEQTEERIIPISREIIGIEPPTEPEKTATQPITTITPPISEQTTKDEESKEEDSSSFLYRLRQERKKRDDEE